MQAETRDQYLERKQAKGTFGTEKPRRWKRRKVRTGICPCPDCGHELMWDCDPNGGQADHPTGCLCCDEVCS